MPVLPSSCPSQIEGEVDDQWGRPLGFLQQSFLIRHGFLCLLLGEPGGRLAADESLPCSPPMWRRTSRSSTFLSLVPEAVNVSPAIRAGPAAPPELLERLTARLLVAERVPAVGTGKKTDFSGLFRH